MSESRKPGRANRYPSQRFRRMSQASALRFAARIAQAPSIYYPSLRTERGLYTSWWTDQYTLKSRSRCLPAVPILHSSGCPRSMAWPHHFMYRTQQHAKQTERLRPDLCIHGIHYVKSPGTYLPRPRCHVSMARSQDTVKDSSSKTGRDPDDPWCKSALLPLGSKIGTLSFKAIIRFGRGVCSTVTSTACSDSFVLCALV
ncbi:hypothetical protein K438DRAFT_835766 [Mycena galopus ATCC 62051]|nr:hypothetical protein K438DRAFT_201549 [Mycena galopus ATCC 62051]KAF8193543.1 hypothetical protein K438DRAFT_835766 [Mycena galopus ATCC 62051]